MSIWNYHWKLSHRRSSKNTTLRNLAHNGFVYMETQKEVYELTQAGNFSNDKLK